jgi:C4-dicarboxylate-binding protein DctP
MMGRQGRRALLAVLAVAGVLAVAACGARGAGAGGGDAAGGENFAIKFSHVVTPATPKGQAAEKFKEVVEQRSGGRITVEI